MLYKACIIFAIWNWYVTVYIHTLYQYITYLPFILTKKSTKKKSNCKRAIHKRIRHTHFLSSHKKHYRSICIYTPRPVVCFKQKTNPLIFCVYTPCIVFSLLFCLLLFFYLFSHDAKHHLSSHLSKSLIKWHLHTGGI